LEKIGLFGGTFDPIHYGHLRSAWEVREKFGLSKIFFIPAAVPPHKTTKAVESPKHRLEMIRLALKDCPELIVSRIELERTGPSYTIDTILHYRSQCGKGVTLFFIIGSDAFLELCTWKDYVELVRLVPFIVMIRPDSSGADVAQKEKALEEFIMTQVPGEYAYHPSETCFIHPDRPGIFVHNATSLDISSTRIRSLIQERKSIRFLTPQAVEDYIIAKGLYT
jgi:nicotinate-nucleotide adenylyltransferase